MKYLMTFTYRDGEGPEEGTPAFDEEMKVWGALNEELIAAGAMVLGTGLTPDAATTLRLADGKETVTDGPYAETKEVLFSFYILDVADLDAALAIARKAPAAHYGSVSIWPTVGYQQP